MQAMKISNNNKAKEVVIFKQENINDGLNQ